MSPTIDDLPPLGHRAANIERPETSRESISHVDDGPILDSHARTYQPASNLRAFLIVFQLCMISFLASFTNGIVTVGLPAIAESI
jgi:hypothetical protein